MTRIFLILTLLLSLPVLALDMNQTHYRSGLISVFPNGYQYSLEDLINPFRSKQAAPSTSPHPIAIKISGSRLKIVYGKEGQEKIFKTGVRLADLKTEVDNLLNRLEGVEVVYNPKQKKQSAQQKSNLPQHFVYRGAQIEIKGTPPAEFKLTPEPIGTLPTKTTSILLVFRHGKGNVYYRRAEDKLLRSLNKGLPIGQVKVVLDGFLNAMK